MDEKYNLIEKYDPLRNDVRFSKLTLNEIYKIITSEYDYIMISLKSTEEYKMDKINEKKISFSDEDSIISILSEEINLDELADNLVSDSEINMDDLVDEMISK